MRQTISLCPFGGAVDPLFITERAKVSHKPPTHRPIGHFNVFIPVVVTVSCMLPSVPED